VNLRVAESTEYPGTLDYHLDKGSSRLTVQAFATGLFSAFGHSPRFNVGDLAGQVELDPEELMSATLELSIKADSLRLTDDVSANDRREIERTMQQEVLETTRYPTIFFKARPVTTDRVYEGLYRVRLAGELTLHGVTRNHSVETQVRLLDDGLRATGETQLKQSEFGIKGVSVAAGMLRVKDEVKLSFDVVARKAQE
jgi:polyisoprenoid-binding protein YceI